MNPRRAVVWERWGIVALFVLGSALRLYRLGAESLWFDEGWSARIAAMPWTTLRNVLLTQPFALYYGLLNLWGNLGQSEFMLRLFSALAGLASLPLLYWISRRLLGRNAALWGVLLLAVSPLHIWYSQEARMYALATLLGLAASWAFLRSLANRRWWIVYAALSALALYTFYYTGLILLCHGVYAAYHGWKERAGAGPRTNFVFYWVGSMILAMLLFAPGLRVLLGQVTGGTWEWLAGKYGRPGLGELLGTAMAYSVGEPWGETGAWRWIGLASFVLIFAAGIGELRLSRDRLVYRSRLDTGTLFWLLYLLLPIGAILVASQIKPAFLIRYLVLFLPAYCALGGRGISRIRPAILQAGVLALLMAATALSLSNLYGKTQKEEWRFVAQQIEQESQRGDVILLIDEDTEAVFSYYYGGELSVLGVSGSARSRSKLEEATQLTDEAERVWVVTSHVPEPVLRSHLASNPDLVLERSWQVIGIELALFRRVR